RCGAKPPPCAALATLETVSKTGGVLPLEPIPDCLDLVGGDFETGRLFEWQRGLRENGSQHGRLQHHRQSEISREAHADRANAGAAAFFVPLAPNPPHPICNHAPPLPTYGPD